MSTYEQRLRRNFAVAAVIHVVVIGGLVLVDAIFSRTHSAPAAVELVTAADILGDLPKGPGVGRGAYAPARQASASVPAAAPAAAPAAPAPAPEPAAAEPNEAGYTPEEEAAPQPQPRAAVQPAHDPNEIGISKKDAGKTLKKLPVATKTVASGSVKPVKTAAKPGGAAAHQVGAHASRTHGVATGGAGTGTGTGPSAGDIRNRFASALAAAEGGTPYGDGRPGGGGGGTSKIIGSLNGAANGEVGGVGKGTPFWWYYQHVHDRMYEAWEHPGQAANWDKRLMAVVMIRVARDGRVVDAWIKDPSGNRLMDDSALAAARRVPRLDPLPEGLGGDTAEISINFQLES